MVAKPVINIVVSGVPLLLETTRDLSGNRWYKATLPVEYHDISVFLTNSDEGERAHVTVDVSDMSWHSEIFSAQILEGSIVGMASDAEFAPTTMYSLSNQMQGDFYLLIIDFSFVTPASIRPGSDLEFVYTHVGDSSPIRGNFSFFQWDDFLGHYNIVICLQRGS